MQQSEKFNSVTVYPVYKNKWCAVYNQLASTFYATSSSYFRVFNQLNNLMGYSVTLFKSSPKIGLCDIFQL